MKKNILILFTFVVVSTIAHGQLRFTGFSPSLYYTYGDYSNGNSSNSIAGYGTIAINNFDYFSLGIEKLSIDNSSWTYDQYNLSAGFLKNIYPFYISANYMHVNGKFSRKDFFYEYNDYMNVYNIGLTYNYHRIFLSGIFSYADLNGYRSVVNRQYEIGFTWLAADYLTLDLKPAHTNLSDGRSLYSVSGSITYYPVKNLTASISGFIGERAYYFNNQLLTVFNQDETQKSMYELRLEYKLSNKILVSGSYQRTEFNSYEINYYILGLKAFF